MDGCTSAQRPPLPPLPDLLVDGSAEAIAGLAAFGALRPGTAVAYAGDADDDELERAARLAGELVVSDSSRRRVVSPSRPRQTYGRVLAADEPVPDDAPLLEPFEEMGRDAQTVAVFDGVAGLRSPFAPGFPQFPEHRPFAAFDRDPATWWEADRELREPGPLGRGAVRRAARRRRTWRCCRGARTAPR